MTSLEKLNKITSEINIQDELQLLEEINNSIKNLEQIRKSKINELTNKTNILTKSINNITKEINDLNRINDEEYEKLSIPEISSSSSSSSSLVLSPIRKSSNIFHVISIKKQELDNLKVEIIKESQILQSLINNLILKERKLIENLNELINKLNKIEDDNFEIISQQDPSILRINLYKNLGIKLENINHEQQKQQEQENGRGGGEKEKEHVGDDDEDMMIITNQDNHTSNILKIEPKLSDFFISNYIWDQL